MSRNSANFPSTYLTPNISSTRAAERSLGILPSTMNMLSLICIKFLTPIIGASPLPIRSPVLSFSQLITGWIAHRYWASGQAALSIEFCILLRISCIMYLLSSLSRSISPDGIASSGITADNLRRISSVSITSTPDISLNCLNGCCSLLFMYDSALIRYCLSVNRVSSSTV